MGSADSAEYKQVTTLFADVVCSMDIAAAVDIRHDDRDAAITMARNAVTELQEAGRFGYAVAGFEGHIAWAEKDDRGQRIAALVMSHP